MQQQPQPRDEGAQLEYLTRDEFIEEFTERHEAGQHAVFFGPTGRGKSTLMADLLKAGPPYNHIAILCPKGPDKAFRGIGKVKKGWPPHLPVVVHTYGEPRPYTIRLEGSPEAGWDHLKGQFQPPLQWARGQRDWLWVIPDLQAMSDHRFAGLGREVEWLMLTLRSRNSGVWLDAQRPAWIPRAAADQTRSVVLFKNTDAGTVDRLRETVSLPMRQILPLMADMKRHDFLWSDGITDELFYVDGGTDE